jgi:hypothetical protein
MNKILFIGASEFVGTRLIDICKNEFDITNFDKQQSPFFADYHHCRHSKFGQYKKHVWKGNRCTAGSRTSR